MEVILLENSGRLGRIGDKVAVKRGYGRNYLIPRGKAILATKDNLIKFEARRAELEKVSAEQLAQAKARQEQLTTLDVKVGAKAGEEGKLFGSVGTKEIANAITQAGVAVHKSEVKLPEGALRQVGEYDILIQVHSEVSANVKITVVAEA